MAYPTNNMFQQSASIQLQTTPSQTVEEEASHKQELDIRVQSLAEDTKFKMKGDKFIYIEPKLLFEGTNIGRGPRTYKDRVLNFALVKINNTQKLVAVSSHSKYSKKWKTYEGSALEALFRIGQQESRCSFYCYYDKASIIDVLKHPNNSIIKEEEFFKFILEKDATGTPRICTLNPESTWDILNILKEKNISIHLHDKPSIAETLFALWAGKGETALTKFILELDPSVIEQNRGIQSVFARAVLGRHKEEADMLLSAMRSRNVILSPEEEWLRRAFENDCAFVGQDFVNLDQQLKIKIFFVANAFGYEAIVLKLKSLGMIEKPLFLSDLEIFALNMDIITAKNVMQNFLTDLKKDKLLITQEDFNKLDRNDYIGKENQIGRIQGKNFIEKIVKDKGLKSIKVPKKIAVIKQGIENLSFHICGGELIAEADQLAIYAECVKPVERRVSLEEAIEFMIAIEKTGYSDFSGENFFIAVDGIYFIDTEFKDFSPHKPPFDTASQFIKKHLNSQDIPQFLTECQKRKEAWNQERKKQEAEEGVLIGSYQMLASAYRKHKFVFQVNSL